MAASPMVGVNRRRRFDPENFIVTTDLEGISPVKGQRSGNGSNTSNGSSSSRNSNSNKKFSKKRQSIHPFRRLRLITSSPSGSGMLLTLRGKTLSLTAICLACFTYAVQRIILRQSSTRTTIPSGGAFVWSSRSYHHHYHHRRPTERELNHLPVVLPDGYLDNIRPCFFSHAFGDEDEDEEEGGKRKRRPSYNHLELLSLQEASIFARRIHPDDPTLLESYRAHQLLENVEEDEEFSSSIYQPDEDLEDRQTVGGEYCARTNWKSSQYPNCNTLHELALDQPPPQAGLERRGEQNYDLRYLGHGHFRDAWLFDSVTNMDDNFVYKRLRLNDGFDVDYRDMYGIHREAIIMERLTHSPRIIDIYGFCSTTILSEAMGSNSEVWKDMIPGTGHATHEEYQEENREAVKPRNNFTANEKLDMALQMAEALADMHGFEGGVMVHGDTHPEQWLRGKDGRLVLNDFNNGEILDWNRDSSKYCGSYRIYGGFYRAPEEFVGSYVDEGIDTFAFGNNIYCLLTGLWPFYEWNSYSEIQGKLLQQERAYVDPRYKTRSFAESKLVEIMEETWTFDPTQRISIFKVVELLREALNENNRRAKKGRTKEKK